MLTMAHGCLLTRWMLALSLGVAVASPALASDAADVSKALLKARHFAELDARMSAVQSEWKKGHIDERELKESFGPFFDPDPALAPLYEAWIKAMPKSYVARLAQGDFEVVRGRAARGGKYAAETSENQFRGLNEANERARKALHASLSLDDRPLLSYYMLIDLTRHDHEDAPRSLLDKGLKLDPHGYLLRRRYMSTLETRWGGSVSEMKAFLLECRGAGLEEPKMRALEAMVEDDEAWVARERSNDLAEAARHEVAAIELAGDGHLLVGECFSCMLQMAGWDEERMKHLERASVFYERAIAESADDGWAWGHLGYCQSRLGQTDRV
jgi:tetratricopeptide (TPR) repeat protein